MPTEAHQISPGPQYIEPGLFRNVHIGDEVQTCFAYHLFCFSNTQDWCVYFLNPLLIWAHFRFLFCSEFSERHYASKSDLIARLWAILCDPLRGLTLQATISTLREFHLAGIHPLSEPESHACLVSAELRNHQWPGPPLVSQKNNQRLGWKNHQSHRP